MARAVIFDVDGTLIDTVDLHAAAWVEIFASYGIDAPFEAVRSQIGKGGDNLMPVFLTPEQLDRWGKEMEARRAELFRTRYFPRARAFPGVRALFERLRADGVLVAIGSSCKADELRRYTDLAGVTDLIDEAATSDDAEHSKPCPDIFQAALRKLPAGITATDVVVVGDSPFDAQAAAKAGIDAVGVRCGGFPDAVLAQAGFHEIYDDPQQLLERYPSSMLARTSTFSGASARAAVASLERADLRAGKAMAAQRNSAPMRALAKAGKLGDQEPLYGLAAGLLLFGLITRRTGLAEAGLRVALAVAAADLVKSQLKRRVRRTRPHVLMDEGRYETGLGGSIEKPEQSFPSGHVAGAVGAALAAGRAVPVSRPYSLAACALLGWSRIGKAAHWPSDVAAGALVGVLAEAVTAPLAAAAMRRTPLTRIVSTPRTALLPGHGDGRKP